MSRPLSWALLLAVMAVAVGYLVYSSASGNTAYYKTVAEVVRERPAGDVRVLGVVQDDVDRSADGSLLTFTIAQDGDSLKVRYRGTVPDVFRPGVQVVVEGRMAGDGVFAADTVFAKCPSKFSSSPSP